MYKGCKTIFPRLVTGEIVEVQGYRYRVSWWSRRTYEFTSVDGRPAPLHEVEFSEQRVSDGIKAGKIKSLKLPI